MPFSAVKRDDLIKTKWACFRSFSTTTRMAEVLLSVVERSNRKSIENSFVFFFREENVPKLSGILCLETYFVDQTDRYRYSYIPRSLFWGSKKNCYCFQRFLAFPGGLENRFVTVTQNRFLVLSSGMRSFSF